MSGLFESSKINGLTLNNRFVRSATYEAMAKPDGSVTDQLLDWNAELAKGQIGLVITSHAYVTREAQAGPGQIGIYSDEMIEGLKRLVSVIHENGSRVVVQLAHAGKSGIGKGEFAPLGPSDVFKEDVKTATAMTAEDIKRTIAAFGDAADRAFKSGFDGLQIHAAHGYMLTQFLSPFYNKREDEYGGTLENRSRLLLQVYEEIRQRVGKTFPIMLKINSEDFLEGGFTVDEMIQVSRMLEKKGIDAIEMSGGTFESGKYIPSRGGTSKSEEREVYYRKAAETFKKELNVPLILVGGFLSLNIAEEAVIEGLADYVALSRSLIREPHLVKRWAEGDRQKARCISCNQCFMTLFGGEGLHCAADKKEKEKEKTAKG